MRPGPPPRIARFLLSLVERDPNHVILEDLTEEYRNYVLLQRGRVRADLWFWRQTLSVAHMRIRDSSAERRSAKEGFAAAFWRDARLALRTLAGSPLYAASVAGVLAIGIGSNGAVIALVRQVLFTPPPYANSDRLTFIWQQTADGGERRAPVQAPDVAFFREVEGEFESLAFLLNPTDDVMRAGESSIHVSVAAVTPGFFSVLGVAPALGLAFDKRDVATAGSRIGLLSHRMWATQFDSNPEIVGTSVDVGGSPMEIVGVLPAAFTLHLPADVGLQRDIDIWMPLQTDLADLRRAGRIRDRDSDNTGVVIGLLRSGSDIANARAEMDRNAVRLREISATHREARVSFSVVPLVRDATARYRPILLVLWVAVALVLMIACANVVGLVLTRASTRRPEFAVRLALGAGRGRLVRQLLAENAVLGAIGGFGGVLIGTQLLQAVPRVFPEMASFASDTPASATVLFASLAIMLPATLGFALAPALIVTRYAGVTGGLRFGVGAGKGTATVGRVLVGAEIGISVSLMVLAGLVWQTARNLGKVDVGFRPSSVAVFDATLRNRATLRGPADRSAAVARMEEAVAELPGVVSVGVIGRLPLSGKGWTQPYGAPWSPPEEWARTEANFRVTSPGYFDAVGTRLIAGRRFTGFDDRQDRRVAIVDRRFASRLAPDGSAIGMAIGIPVDGDAVVAEIVGVVENVRWEGVRTESRETVYVPYRHEASRDVSFAVRYRDDATPDFATLREALAAAEPDVATFDYSLLDSYVDESMRAESVAVDLIGAFAILAALLAASGLFGVVAYSAGRRRAEMAVRIALGATRADVVAAMVRPDLRTIGLGLLAGILGTGAIARTLENFFYGVGGIDPGTYLAAAAAMGLTALVAIYLPARKASRIDPVRSLRQE